MPRKACNNVGIGSQTFFLNMLLLVICSGHEGKIQCVEVLSL